MRYLRNLEIRIKTKIKQTKLNTMIKNTCGYRRIPLTQLPVNFHFSYFFLFINFLLFSYLYICAYKTNKQNRIFLVFFGSITSAKSNFNGLNIFETENMFETGVVRASECSS